MTGHAGSPELSDEEITKIMVSELQRLYGRIDNTSTVAINVIQFIVLVFGAAFLVATKHPEAIVVMPIFWTVWLLYALKIDHEALKCSVVARHLENQINKRMGTTAFVWQSKMSERSNGRSFISRVNYALWATLNATAWVIGIRVTFHNGHHLWAYLLIAIWATTWIASIFSGFFMRKYYLVKFNGSLPNKDEIAQVRGRDIEISTSKLRPGGIGGDIQCLPVND